MKLALRVFFRKVYLTGASQVPADKPVILACNHPNSFLDAVVLAVLLSRPLHFLARADVFKGSFKCWILHRLHLIPIYRQEEGAASLHRNAETFARCYEILENKGAILIFSEGVCVLEKRLRPLRKGTARLALGAEAHFNFLLDLQVVPIGINYTYPDRFRQEVMIRVGQPIAIHTFKALYQSNPAKALLAFNHTLTQQLQQHIIHIPTAAQEQGVEAALKLCRAHSPDYFSANWFSASPDRLDAEMAIARNTVQKSRLYLPEERPQQYPFPGQPTGKHLICWGLAGFPFIMAGLTFMALPGWLAVVITNQKVSKREFYASVLLVLGLFLFWIYWLLITLAAIAWQGWIGGISALVLPACAFLALCYWDRYQLWRLSRVLRKPSGHYTVKAQGLQEPVR